MMRQHSDASAPPERLQLWGGAECTVNRCHSSYFDQTYLTGHQDRLDDLDRFADLGITAMRYPVLWERTAPHGVQSADWRWSDERLNRLRELEIEPIVGLVHHGSGPPSTSLVDEAFPEKLASYASAVARRYPWVKAYTPVNEPLTTARFSGLYGHWYPHGHDDQTFVRSLLTQCKAVVLAMRAIRAVRSDARLVQTDDLGRTWSTPLLAYQARIENHRRWLSFDLLTGRIDSAHPLWEYLRQSGASEACLLWFRENPCPPDLLGINHYLSSERYLDEHLERYPRETHGGNGRHAYADVLAARARRAGASGPEAILLEAWERYQIPLAVTEVHNGCTREEQMRWFHDVWNAAERLRDRGVDVRAVTAWSLLGATGWNTLVTGEGGIYEPGVYDIRGSSPRATAMVALLRDLSGGRRPQHPLLQVAGWWRRPVRHMYGVAVDDDGTAQQGIEPDAMNWQAGGGARPVIISGATGTLGYAFARLCDLRGIPYLSLSRHDMDITDRQAIEAIMQEFRPWAVINAAEYVRVDEAETDVDRCHRENARGPELLAEACARYCSQLMTFSSDFVFDGFQTRPYLETDPVSPLNEYGRSKVEGEARVLNVLPAALIVRSSALFGPWDEHNFVTVTRRTLESGLPVSVENGQTLSPTYIPDLVDASLDLLIDGASGIWHLANEGAVTRASLARDVASAADLDGSLVTEERQPRPGRSGPRPRYSVLGTARGQILPPLADALARYFEDRPDPATPAPAYAFARRLVT